MKKALVFLVLFIGVLAACTKSTDSSNHPTTYRVDGITDITLGGDSGSVAYISYNVNYIGPIQETVSLSFEGLPVGVKVDESESVMNGIPTFSASLLLVKTDAMDMKGTYDIKLICNGSKTGKKSYNLKLKILAKSATPIPPPVTRCDSAMAGNWDTCFDFCSGSPYMDVITVDGTVANRIHFANFQGYNIQVFADLNCDSATFVIPRQTFLSGDAAIWGSGAGICN